MLNKLSRRSLLAVRFSLLLGFVLSSQITAAYAQTLVSIDASAAISAPTSAHLHMGTATAPNGERLEINSQYLLRNGLPWLPVMGEFHYSRSPAATWETELKKMKSAGVDVVSSYVIWSHHEQQQGHFDWQGNRDLHRFIALCGKIGLNVVVRIGPWAHAEVRYGGVPDWVVNSMPTRSDDAQYLQYVERLYSEIGAQLKGQLWKQGGPVIGVQIENEYNLSGVGQGAQHIRTLKALALKAGMDVPLYTVTGWDNTLYPQGEVVPVFGGYPDEPWAVSTSELAPKETYAFRFGSRVSGDLGAQTVASAPGTANLDTELTPFLGAEYGAGLPFMYRRRTVVTADDIASMLPVQLGSGVNLLGYYMFHGGRNPMTSAGTAMQESSISGGYNDTTMISYDFQAPLGPDGQQREVLTLLRPYHYFLHDFGSRLAPMAVRKPVQVPVNESELSSLRWSVRSNGDSGFLFVNNHVRQYAMPMHSQVRFSVKLATQTLVFPSQPVDIANDSYFMWPINLDMDGTCLSYAAAQPVARLDNGKQGVMYVFAASASGAGMIAPELGFDAAIAPYLTAPGARIVQQQGRLVVDQFQPGSQVALTINRPGARSVTLLILSPQQLRQLSIGKLAGQRRLVLSSAQSYFSDDALELRSAGQNQFQVEIFPALTAKQISALPQLKQAANDGVFQVLHAQLPAVHFDTNWSLTRAAKAVAPVAIGGLAQAALEPKPENFSAAAAWKISLPATQLQQALAADYVADVLLNLDFVGDVGRLFAGTKLLDDWYYSGYGWQLGLRQYATELLHQPQPDLSLTVLPLRADAPIYLPKEARPDFAGAAQLALFRNASLTPVYRLRIHP